MKKRLGAPLAAALAMSAFAIAPSMSAQAYTPTPGVLFELPQGADCLKGTGNCIVYPKTAQLPSGRLIAAFEDSRVPKSGSAVGQTVPVWKSDDDGDSWQPLTSVKAPAEMSTDPSVRKYTSNWTNPFFYVLPQDVGTLKKGTLLLATVVSGQDEYYVEHKAADPSWTPTNDGDRRDMAIALYSSTDDGASWTFQNIVAKGGWQGGSAGATGTNISKVNTTGQVDPVWEPYLMVRNDQLVAYYSDENDYLSYDTSTGKPVLDPDNDSAKDSKGQILAHRTWDGSDSAWSGPVVDVAGLVDDMGGGKSEIGGGRPGMANVVPTTDGKWMLTFEYFGGGANVHFKMEKDPLKFYADTRPGGEEISRGDGQQGALPFAAGSRGLAWGGSPVVIRRPDGSLVYNAASSGDVWVNYSGKSDGVWTQMRTTLGGGYSRNLTYDDRTGRVVILRSQWLGAGASPTIEHGEVDLGNSKGDYFQIQNVKTGQVIGTGGNITEADRGNGDKPDVRLEDAGSTSNPDTEAWHTQAKSDGSITLLNKAGGRAASVWTGNATEGQAIGQWVDDTAYGTFNMVTKPDGTVYFQSTRNTALYLTGASKDAGLTLQRSDGGSGAQDWKLLPLAVIAGTPKISGTTLVGKTLTADPGSWSDGAALAYQWLADGSPIRSATDRDYTLTADEIGKRIAVSVTGTRSGYSSSSATSAQTEAVQGVLTAGEPKISGSPVVGGTLQVDPGTWNPSDTTLTFQWNVGGAAVPGATSTTYSPSSADVGKPVSVTVSGTRSGYQNASKTSAPSAAVTAPVPVAKATITSSGPATNGWYRQSVVVALSAPEGRKVQYAVGDGAFRDYRSPISVTANGVTTISTRVLDARNSVISGSAAQVVVSIDKTAPAATASREPGVGKGTPRNPLALTFAGTDTYSGVAAVEYRVNDGDWTAVNAAPLVLDKVGDYVVSYRATDRAGNMGAVRSITASIAADPATTVKATSASVKAGGNLTLSLNGFVRYDAVVITVGATSASVLTDVNGSARITLPISAGAAAGKTTVTATGSSGSLGATTTVTVR